MIFQAVASNPGSADPADMAVENSEINALAH